MWLLLCAAPAGAVEIGVGARRDASDDLVIDGAELWLTVPTGLPVAVRIQGDATGTRPDDQYLDVVQTIAGADGGWVEDRVVRASVGLLLDTDFGIEGPDDEPWISPHAQVGVWGARLHGLALAGDRTEALRAHAFGPALGMAATVRWRDFGVQLCTQARWRVLGAEIPVQIVSGLDLVLNK